MSGQRPMGTRPKWEAGFGPRTDGSKPEYHDEKGLFHDEREQFYDTARAATVFVSNGAYKGDVQVGNVVTEQLDVLSAHALARSRSGETSVELHTEKVALQRTLDNVKPADATAPTLRHADGRPLWGIEDHKGSWKGFASGDKVHAVFPHLHPRSELLILDGAVLKAHP